jgi:hypothetical protein
MGFAVTMPHLRLPAFTHLRERREDGAPGALAGDGWARLVQALSASGSKGLRRWRNSQTGRFQLCFEDRRSGHLRQRLEDCLFGCSSRGPTKRTLTEHVRPRRCLPTDDTGRWMLFSFDCIRWRSKSRRRSTSECYGCSSAEHNQCFANNVWTRSIKACARRPIACTTPTASTLRRYMRVSIPKSAIASRS